MLVVVVVMLVVVMLLLVVMLMVVMMMMMMMMMLVPLDVVTCRSRPRSRPPWTFGEQRWSATTTW